MLKMFIENNLEIVKRRIADAAYRSGRNPEEITLVAVTKNQQVEDINIVLDSGVTDIGENRSQELFSKYEALGSKTDWHFIGHLQRNKVRYIIPFVYLIQSVDSLELAIEIDKRASKLNKIQDILLEVNVSGEQTKHGFHPDEVESKVEEISSLKNVCVRGLMTMAPFIEEAESLREHFAKLKEIFDNLSKKQGFHIEMKYLSMGMTNDFEIAIEEGSNMVRIGTAIFKTSGGDIHA